MNLTVILDHPQNIINIAVVTRAMRNFGCKWLRLVEPAEYDPVRIEGIAHQTGDVIARTEQFGTLQEALADLTHVVGFTARGRAAKRSYQRPADLVDQLTSFHVDDRVGFLFGREDKGLSNAELDQCNAVVSIPTSPEHPSLNLAQAVTIALYETFARQHNPPFKSPRREAPAASREHLEGMFGDLEIALRKIAFFKSDNDESIMRALREILHRANLDEREASLFRAVAKEVLNFARRTELAAE